MELSRILRILRYRWGIVALIAATGFLSGFGLTALANDDVEPVFEAIVDFKFELSEEETPDELADEIDSERGLAVFAAQDLLGQIPGATVVADRNAGLLTFIALGDSEGEAQRNVFELVQAYVDADSIGGGSVSQQLAAMETQAEEIDKQIRDLEQNLTPAEEELANQHMLLDLIIQSVSDEIVALTVASAGAPSDIVAANQDRIQDLEAIILERQAEKSALAPPPSESLSAIEQLRLSALQRRKELLELDYQRLSLRAMGVTSVGGTQQPLRVLDLTPEPPSPFVNGVVGLMGGLGFGLLGLVLTTRARREVWLPMDLPMTFLGVVPKRKADTVTAGSWYDGSPGGPRKEAVQALRTTIEGTMEEPGSTIALLGDKVDPVDVQSLGVDLAAAFASAGRRVLIVDADFSADVELTEFKVGEPSLNRVFHMQSGSRDSIRERIAALLDDAIQIRPGLVVVPSGEPPASPADSLAGVQFQVFLDEAKAKFDLVFAIAGSGFSPASQVVAQRAGAAIVAVTPGKTTIPGLEGLVADFSTQRINDLGAVMVSGGEAVSNLRRLSLAPKSVGPDRTAPESVSEIESPVNRLRFYPFPMDKGTASSGAGSLRSLVGDLATVSDGAERAKPPLDDASHSDIDDGLADEVLTALGRTTPRGARESVAHYVTARVEDMLTAVSGQENLSNELIDVVLEFGFIPLTPVRGRRTVGDWIVEELRVELGAAAGARVAGRFAEVLMGPGSEPSNALNRWLTEHFFERHIERTGGEPEVWHIRSQAGTLQLLAYGRRLTRKRLTLIANHVTRRAIDDLQRKLQAANDADDLALSEEVDAQLRDLHLFEVALGMLQVGSSNEARLHYPWRRAGQQPQGWVPVWTEGIRANIAPLQKLGILASPLLSEEELVSMQPTL